MSEPDSGQSQRWVLSKGRLVVGAVAAFVMAITGFGWAGYNTAVGQIITSHVLPGVLTPVGQDQNILLMGLDSRLDQNGQPLPQDMYDALHAGDETSGGYNANVLIVVHIPGNGGPISAVSIPRDDYVNLAGCPGSVCKGKVKQAYGFAYQQALDAQANGSADAAGAKDLTAREQAAREAGRKAQIDTVSEFLGVQIDHFVEVTLAAFFQIAKTVQPITVCLNHDTIDEFSGANFHEGVQQIDASQAMAFVRQRRDENDGSFTDMDRTRRQQAFLVSLLAAVRQGGAMSNPAAIRNILNVAHENVAIDSGLNIVDFAARASELTKRPTSFYTLPISDFGADSNGSDVNIVDLPTIRQIVHDRFSSDPVPEAPSAAAASAPPALSTPVVLNVVNATSRDGLAAAVEDAFTARGFTRGRASTAETQSTESSIMYGEDAQEGAQALADQLRLPMTESGAVAPGTVQLTVGSQFPVDNYIAHHSGGAKGGSSGEADPADKMTAVAATGTGVQAPAPTDLSQLTANGIPCVK
ncbi:LCP family protein [Mycobacteroides abscessus]|uniref:LCP family protein n=1 Tax=Mycobacteroides abscessus TaxID=36809 RepID=UPI00078DA178|nr:LCP family protein [Mycobacteroides abscessus]AMU22214.1 transcriptional regulator [Mycobacteroides abscessus]SHY78622.1 membrane-bound protein lytR [Mycobacteroides abscessus subsp. bolletii]SHY96117.1 membrane-bound protein lytR [Mycobacteroides abscessus subsp. bolletii]SKS10525.1 cell envelope-related function transcriptional attenuator common domain family protein [Mycobacteroides abscessus subsp. bolletii]SKS75075.1 cell envelope-related function transcriptional attenuator common doma